MSASSRARGFRELRARVQGVWGAFWRDELGAELIQFVLALPIVLGLVWTAFEAWQLMSVRAAVRTTTAQAARYVTAFGAPLEVQGPPPNPGMICAGVRQLVTESLAQQRGNLGDNLDWTIRWYQVLDSSDSRWEGNVALACIQSMDGIGDDCCAGLLSALVCNDQFAVELEVSVPWQTVVFGLDRSATTTSVLRIAERATGSAPCVPYCSIEVGGRTISGGDEGCIAEVCWGWQNKCTYEPDRCQVYVDDELVATVYNPRYDNCRRVEVPVGGASVEVICLGGRREASDSVTISCDE